MLGRPFHRRAIAVCAAAMAIALGASCGGTDDDTLVVFVASSLTDAFAAIEEAFERRRPGVDVVVNAGGSSSLAAQIEQGAPAAVFAAADQRTVDLIADEAAGDPVVFARNRLVIAVAEGNPFGVSSLADLERDDLVVVLAAPEVPAGAYARAAATELGVDLDADSLEQNVRAVAAKVRLGEADAGVVYRTDVRPDDERVDAVAIESAVAAAYPIVALADGDLAADFVAFVTGPEGRDALIAAGFEVP